MRAIRCTVQAIAETIGQMPVGIFQRGDGGTNQEFQDHPAYGLLNEAGSTLREQLTCDALLEPRGDFARYAVFYCHRVAQRFGIRDALLKITSVPFSA